MCFKYLVYQIRVKTLLSDQNSLTNDQNGQTVQKMKVGQNSQKLIKKLKTARKGFSLPTSNKEVLNKTLYQICPKTLQITQN